MKTNATQKNEILAVGQAHGRWPARVNVSVKVGGAVHVHSVPLSVGVFNADGGIDANRVQKEVEAYFA